MPHSINRQEAIEHGHRHGMAARKTIRSEDEERIVEEGTRTTKRVLEQGIEPRPARHREDHDEEALPGAVPHQDECEAERDDGHRAPTAERTDRQHGSGHARRRMRMQPLGHLSIHAHQEMLDQEVLKQRAEEPHGAHEEECAEREGEAERTLR